MRDETTPSLRLIDKTGCVYFARAMHAQDRPTLEKFYDTFEPKRAAQGLPPADPARTRQWLNQILGKGRHVVMEPEQVGTIAGHMMLVPAIGEERCLELATFVHQSVRNRGLGTLLNQVAVRLARSTANDRIWLSVEASNTAAIRSFERAGFNREKLSSLWAPEIEMGIDLTFDPSPAPMDMEIN